MKSSLRFTAVALGVFLLVGVSSGVLAQQNTGNAYVRVSDTSGEPLPGVTVELSGFGATQVRVTDSEGEVRFVKLDPGDWSLKASLEGFSTVEYARINVRAARNSTVEIEMSSSIQEVITVTSESPLLDEKKVAAGTTISQIELEKIPTARDPWAVLTQTPGVVVDRINVGGNESGQQSNFRGPGLSQDENAFLVDGVEVTDMTAIGASATYYDFDQFTEMQFETGGSEITKTSGGVSINMVTKRGTNEFRGSARFLVTDSDGLLFLQQSSPDINPGELADSQDAFIGNSINKIEEWGFEAGGPVVKDRLWFWGSHGQNDIKNLTGGASPDDVQPDDTILTNTAFKVNAQISSNNSAVGSWNNGDKEKFGRNAGPTRPQETTWDQRGPSAIIKFEDTHVFNSNFFLTGGYSKVDAGFSLTSKAFVALGNDAPQAHQNSDGVWEGSFWNGGSSRPSQEVKLDGSYFFNSGTVSHELKFGARLREFEHNSPFGWSNNNVWSAEFFGPGKNPAFLRTQRGLTSETELSYGSIWLQDTLSAGQWTINAGLRYDLQEGENLASTADENFWFPALHPTLDYPGEDAPFDWDTISPRVGITYALGDQRKTLLRASLARFAEQLEISDVSRTNPAGPSYLQFAWFDDDGSGDFNGATTVVGPDGSILESGRPGPDSAQIIGTVGFDLSDPLALSSPNQTDPGLDPEVTDELILSVEHALMPEFVIGGGVTFRQVSDVTELRSFVRDGDGVVRVATRNDYALDRVEAGTLPNGVAYTVPVYSLDESLSYTGGQLLINGDRERDYVGYNVNFTKRLSNQWMLRGYVQFGEAEWDVPESARLFTSPNVCEDDGSGFGCNGAMGGSIDGGIFAEQSAGSGAKADVWLQSSWQYNVNGMYQVAPDRPWGFNVAANIFGREGYPLPYFLEGVAAPDGQTRDLLAVSELDDFRVDDLFTVDLRVDKEFAASGDVSFTLGLDVFNLLNENYTIQRERRLNVTSADFLRETLSPRIWRISARLNWK